MRDIVLRYWRALRAKWSEYGVRAAFNRNARAADALDAAVKEMLKQ
ncbi:hypothetical protein [Celeribacter marinus]